MAPPSLVALTGPLRGRTFNLAADRLAVGRHPSNDLRIPELSVSRHHCTLYRAGGEWRVTDLDSRLGTFINGRPVHEAPLRHSDLMAIGDSTFFVCLEEEAKEAEVEPVPPEGSALVGESPGLRRAVELMAKVAPTTANVLIVGESGTGKELAARTLHTASRRAGHPFVAVHCATLSETLLEDELFGHEKGAFTGAVARKAGKLEAARGGTLFLKEVGELPLALQARLLRVLQERTFERVGGTQPLTADIRLITATERDLAPAIAAGTFRSDLSDRLNVITLPLSPLRERREDIPLLAAHFSALHGRAVRGRPLGIAPAARSLLLRYAWPGNIRELSNAIERAVVLGQDDVIQPDDLPETLLETGPGTVAGNHAGYHEALNRFKREVILEALAASGGSVARAAERLGLHPNHLHRRITSLGLRSELESTDLDERRQ